MKKADMIRKTIIALLVLLAAGLLLVGWLGEGDRIFDLSPEHKIIAGRWEYWPRGWPVEGIPHCALEVTLHGCWGEWVTLGSIHPNQQREGRRYNWLDASWRDKQGNTVRMRSLLITAPVVPFAVLLLSGYPAIAFIQGPYRRFRRRRQGRCLKCGYNLTGNLSGICPECGVKTTTSSLGRVRRRPGG